MKKITLVAFVFCTICVMVGAQVTFGSWGRAVVTPVAFMGKHSAVSAATSTWGDVPRIGFSANGTSPNGSIGFNLDFDFGIDVTKTAQDARRIQIIGDNAKAWIKPLGLALPEKFDMFKLTAGFFKEDELRGRIGVSEFSSWLIYRQSRYFLEWGSPNEDYIFQRFDAVAGAHFKLEPLKWWESEWNGFGIHGAFGSNSLGAPSNSLRAILNFLNNEDNNTISEQYDENYALYDGDRTVSATDVFRAMQLALSYRIPNVGLARVQFIGNNRNVFRWDEVSSGMNPVAKKLMTGLSTNKDADIIEIAFLYDGLEELKVDIGGKIPIKYPTKHDFIVYPLALGSDGKIYPELNNSNNKEYNVQLPYVVAAGVSWTPSFLTALNLVARLDATFGGTIESEEDGKSVKNGMIVDMWLMPSYAITPNIKAGIDIAIDIHGLDVLKITGENPVPARTAVSEFIDYGFGPWFELAGGGARARVGVVVMLPGSARYKTNPSNAYMKYSPILTGEPVISIPISFTYSF